MVHITEELFKETTLKMLENIESYVNNISVWNVTYHWHDKLIFKRANRITHADRMEISLEKYLPDKYLVRVALIINEHSKAEVTIPSQDFIDKFKAAFKLVSSKTTGDYYADMLNDFFGPQDIN